MYRGERGDTTTPPHITGRRPTTSISTTARQTHRPSRPGLKTRCDADGCPRVDMAMSRAGLFRVNGSLPAISATR